MESMQGRSSCIKVSMAVLLVLMISFSPEKSFAATHIVGDSQGWGLGTSYRDWASGRNFSTGDTIVFNYQIGFHSVARVNAAGYKSCRVPTDSAKIASTGTDKFILKKGPNYFICGTPGHCPAGMKIQANAS